MKPIICIGVGLIAAFLAGVVREAYGFGELRAAPALTTCNVITSVNGQFSPTESRYTISGNCTVFADLNQLNQQGQESTFDKQKPLYEVPWSAAGTYTPASKATVEQIVVFDPNHPQQKVAEIMTTMVCVRDPWRDPSTSPCNSVHSQTSGNPAALLNDGRLPNNLGWLYPDPNNAAPWTSMLPPDKRAFLQKQYADWQKGQSIRQAAGQPPLPNQIVFPLILSPVPGQSFYAQATVPIKLAPPQGWSVAGYTVAIQKKDARGNWVNAASLPVSAAEAQSATGYTRFGPGGPSVVLAGVPPVIATTPGTWRMNAQVSSPAQSGWSNWIEFLVMQPKFTVPAGIIRK